MQDSPIINAILMLINLISGFCLFLLAALIATPLILRAYEFLMLDVLKWCTEDCLWYGGGFIIATIGGVIVWVVLVLWYRKLLKETSSVNLINSVIILSVFAYFALRHFVGF